VLYEVDAEVALFGEKDTRLAVQFRVEVFCAEGASWQFWAAARSTIEGEVDARVGETRADQVVFEVVQTLLLTAEDRALEVEEAALIGYEEQ